MPAWTTGLSLIDQLLDSIGYAVFNSLAYAVLTIFAVTLLSLTYGFFVAGRDESGLPSP
jgi:ABC-type Fe3+ transport system permease subunit